MADSYPGAPRWVKVFGAGLSVLVLAIAVVVIAGVGGPHGPGRHGLPESAAPVDSGPTIREAGPGQLSPGQQ